MARVIKFRGWDTKKKIVYSAEEMGKDELTINPDGRGFVNVNGKSTSQSHYCSHIVPLQFTEAKDSEGNELYEDDIVEITFHHDPERPKVIGAVKWGYDCGFSIYAINSSDVYSMRYKTGGDWGINNAIKRIGSIHENPELLEATMTSRYTFRWQCHTEQGVATGRHTIEAVSDTDAWDTIKKVPMSDIEGLPDEFSRIEWLQIRMVEAKERERDDE